MNNGINHLLAGAGFLSSTVLTTKIITLAIKVLIPRACFVPQAARVAAHRRRHAT
jgi:hypothetical protein